MHFSQIASIKGGDFSELRSYVVSKLLWNVDIDVDAVIHSFLKGYYGNAAPYLYKYLVLQEGALLGSKVPLWIYDTPVTHKNGMLSKTLLKRYNELFDEAEQAVAGNVTLLNRVRESRLPIQFAELEIARTEPITDPEVLKNKVELFRQRAEELGVVHLNERNNTIEAYCNLYVDRNLVKRPNNIAQGMEVTYLSSPNPPYDKIAAKALTDGLYGGASFNESWVGWNGKDAEFVIDLKELHQLNGIDVDFLHNLGAWNMDTITKSLPQTFVMIGSVVSIVVAPPVDIGASLPNHRNRSGAARSAIISRSMLLTNAIVPNSAPLYWVIIMLESE